MSMTPLSKMSIRISIIIMLCFTTCCDSEKYLLHSYRKAGLEILFDPKGGNPSRRKDLVRNGIPVPIKVMLYSDKFGEQDVTEKVKDNWQYLDPNLGKVLYDSTMSAYVYLHDSTNIGFQKIMVTLEAYSDTSISFEVSPVELIKISSDTFLMGSNDDEAQPDEKPVHNVVINSFLIGKYEITNIEYLAYLKKALASGDLIYYKVIPELEGFYTTSNNEFCLGINQSQFRYDGKTVFIESTPETNFEDYPVTGVTWKGATLFARYNGMRLPTEAEWEWAAGGGERKYPWGNKEPTTELANYAMNVGQTTPVGSYHAGATPEGLMDMAGNVFEWCFDFYKYDFYKNRPVPDHNPTGPDSTFNLFERVIRGGSFSSHDFECRASNRDSKLYNASEDHLGFRVVR